MGSEDFHRGGHMVWVGRTVIMVWVDQTVIMRPHIKAIWPLNAVFIEISQTHFIGVLGDAFKDGLHIEMDDIGVSCVVLLQLFVDGEPPFATGSPVLETVDNDHLAGQRGWRGYGHSDGKARPRIDGPLG